MDLVNAVEKEIGKTMERKEDVTRQKGSPPTTAQGREGCSRSEAAKAKEIKWDNAINLLIFYKTYG